MSPLARKPVAGPYLLKAGEYPFTLALFRERDGVLVWALSVLKPQHGLLRMLEIPPAAQWVGERVDSAMMRPDEWPGRWTRVLG